MDEADFLAGGGVMGGRIRDYDWSSTPLGPIEQWPTALKIALNLVLNAKFEGYIAWGPELISLYNDSYLPLLRDRSDVLGLPVSQAWPEVWDSLEPILKGIFRGEAIYFENTPLIVHRNGYPKKTWWTSSFSPIRDETGEVRGVLGIVKETTIRVLAEQRLQFLIELGTSLRGVSGPDQAMAVATEMLGRYLEANGVGFAEIAMNGEIGAVKSDWSDPATPALVGLHRIDEFGPHVVGELRAGHTIRLDDALADSRIPDEAAASAFINVNARAAIIVPLIRDGRFAATLYVRQREPRQWRDEDVGLAEEVAARIWEAVGRLRAESALKESEERFRRFAEHSSAVIWILDLETRRLEYLSPAYETIWGEPAEAAMSDPDHWASRLHPDDYERGRIAVERAAKGEDDVQEYHIVRPDGGVRWIRGTFFPIRDEQGRIRKVGGIADDITQHDGAVVYVVDGDPDERRSLCLLLQRAGYDVKTFESADKFLNVAPVLVPGCVIVDIRSPESGHLTIPRDLKARRLRLPVIVIGEARGNVDIGVQAMKAGAVDFVDAPYAAEQMLDVLASALASIREIAGRDQAAELAKAHIAVLSVREREVLNGLLSGGTNKTIARDLDISPRTVEAHRARIMERLGAHSLPELVQIAVLAGFQQALVKE